MNTFLCRSLAIVFGVLLYGCKTPYSKYYHNFTYNDFKQKTLSNQKILKLDSLNQGIDICIIAKENLLLVIDIHDKFYVKAYDLNTLKYLKSFIPKGAGLNQQLSCRSIQGSDNGRLYASDTYKKKIFIYDLNDIRKPLNQVLPIDEININSKYFFRPIVLPDNREIQLHQIDSSKKRFVFDFFNQSGQFISNQGKYPDIEADSDPVDLNYIYKAGVNLSDDKRYLVVNYYNLDFLELYNLNGKLLKRIQGPDILKPEVRTVSVYGGTMPMLTKDSRRAYTGKIKMNGDKIFVLYNGKLSDNPDFHSNKLFTFNKELRPDVYYKLSIPVYGFDINWQTKTMYALSMKNKSGNLILMKL